MATLTAAKLKTMKVSEIRELLNELKLPAKGNKNKLIETYLNAKSVNSDSMGKSDVNISDEREKKKLSDANSGNKIKEKATNEVITDDEIEKEVVSDVESTCESDIYATSELQVNKSSANLENEKVRNEILKKELELARKENELLLKENSLIKKEKEIEERQNSMRSVKSNFMQLAELIPKFDGSSVGCWISQVETVQRVYDVLEDDMKILVINKLTGTAKDWFYSKPNFIELSFKNLIVAIKEMFDCRIEKIKVRRSFENRKWSKDETFANYYHQKLILGNQLSIPDDELIDYLIDGMNNSLLQAQARIRGFLSPQEMLATMSKLTLPERLGTKVSENIDRTSNLKVLNKRPTNTSMKTRCGNCNAVGHRSSECKRSPKEQNKCFKCDQTGHFIKDCPQSSSELQCIHPGYQVKLSSSNFKPKTVITAIIDSGSPISIIKQCFVSNKVIKFSNDSLPFTGINNSRLNVIGLFEDIVKVNDKECKIKFRVVPNCTTSYDCILGRDFIVENNASITITGNEFEIKFPNDFIDDNLNQANLELLHIDLEYDNSPEIVIGEISPKDKILCEKLIADSYLNAVKPSEPETKFEFRIELKKETPFYFTPRRLSVKEKQIVNEIIDDLLDRKIIRPSSSPYASRVVLVPKKNGQTRMCIDYRELNKFTVRDRFPLPLIDDHLDRLKGKKYYSLLDLKSGFNQIKLSEDSIKYTAFVTPTGQYEYLRMPFGLANAPAAFTRFINLVFQEMISDGKVLCYFDDILVATESLNEHFLILNEVFKILVDNCLELNLSKCSFIVEQIKYLGYLVNSQGILPNPDHITAILNYPIPKDVHSVRRFLGLVGFCRKFIQDMAVIAKPLTDLLKKNISFEFGDKELNSFETLKNKLITAPVLSIYSPIASTELHCDASALGFGAILLQKQSDNCFHPIAYFSKRTSDSEAQYHSFELETLAIVLYMR